MKEHRSLLALGLIVAAVAAVMAGCSYDVAEPMWDKPAPEVVTPSITGVVPPQAAVPGVNMITIQGQGFPAARADLNVYFNSTPAEVVTSSATSITVRRPNLFASSAEIKVVSAKSYMAAKRGPYAIDTVMERFGSFVANIPLATVAVDSVENIFVVAYGSPYTFWKVAPNGIATMLTVTEVSPALKRTYSDARIHNGGLYLLGYQQREIQLYNPTTGQLTRWTRLPPGIPVDVGDFDGNGYFYTGGASTDLCVIPPSPPVSLTATQIKTAGAYLTDEIQAIRVYGGSVYVASRQANTPNAAKIFRHTIDAAGNLGSQSLVVDLAGISTSVVKGIAFSASGTIYLTIDDPNPLVAYDPTTKALDFFYKSILPPHGQHSAWGKGTNLYMISNDPTAQTANIWNVIRIRMGQSGVRYF